MPMHQFFDENVVKTPGPLPECKAFFHILSIKVSNVWSLRLAGRVEGKIFVMSGSLSKATISTVLLVALTNGYQEICQYER